MITGKVIYDIALEHFVKSGLERVEWQDAPYMHDFYNGLTESLNETHINPLLKLISDLAEGLQDCWDNEYSLNQLNDLRGRAKDVLKYAAIGAREEA